MVLGALRSAGSRGRTLEELSAHEDLAAPLHGAEWLSEALERLEESGFVVRSKGRWLVVEESRFRRGVYRRVQRKLGVVEVEPAAGKGQRLRQLSIRERDRAGARDGDVVLVRRVMGKPEAAPHPLGAVTRVLTRRRERLVALVDGSGSGPPTLRTFDPRLRHDARDVDIKPGKLKKLAGHWVVVEVSEKKSGELVGRIEKVLGEQAAPGVDVDVIVHHHEIPADFPDEVLADAAQAAGEEISERPRKGPRRSNLVRTPTVTIDGISAKDFDDAISVSRLPRGGFRLMVHIADVAHYVQLGSALDLEARRRGTSVYFPERVVPMLPPVLSDDVCSLRPDELRYAMTVDMTFDERGRRTGERFFNSLIRSDRRMTYPEVARFLEGDEGVRAELPGELVEMLDVAGELVRLLDQQRWRRGALQFERGGGGSEISIGPDLEVLRREAVSSASQRLIEEFMLVTNETVATVLHADEAARRADELAVTPGVHLYRHHPVPDASDIVEAWSQLVPDDPRLDASLSAEDLLEELARRGRELGREDLAQQLLMRALTRAGYTAASRGHFALALDHYCYSTSPIRRYPDLVMHRRLKELIASRRSQRRGRAPKAPTAGEAGLSPRSAGQLAAELSKLEQRAESAERDLRKWRVVRHLAQRLEEERGAGGRRRGKSSARQRRLEIDGVVTGALDFGLFVQLDGYGVDALLPVDALDDDWYELARSGLEFVGRSSGRRFQLGDRLRLRLREVDEPRRRINVELAD